MNNRIYKIQQRLSALGYNPGPIDGIRGRGTIGAIKEFQSEAGLEVDGLVGPQTWDALFETAVGAISFTSDDHDPLMGVRETPGCFNIDDAGLGLITTFEGVRLEAYQDSVGVWTIGIGHTKNVRAGQTITYDQAKQMLREDVQWVEECINDRVTVPLSQSQVNALGSFVFNLGCGAFAKSTLLRKLNAGDERGAAQEFHRWNKAGGVVLAGLTRRRREEARLFSNAT